MAAAGIVFRILLLADTHIGLDFPLQPRVKRRRRGHDFLANFRTALQPALAGQVDAVVHGGDLFDRSRIPAALVQIALEPLVEAARAGVPVFLVPGNHERGCIPLHLWRSHPNLYIFDQPTTFSLFKDGATLALAGFPHARQVRTRFAALLQATGWVARPADIRVLCMHQAFEGAQVGPADFTFRCGDDVVPATVLPAVFDAVLSGHIHRSQVLRRDLAGRRLVAPVVYPGSVERTAFAEQAEEKGYRILQFETARPPGKRLARADFAHLPARPMVTLVLDVEDPPDGDHRACLRAQLAALPPDAVVRIRVPEGASEGLWRALGAASLRELAPEMNIEIAGSSFHKQEGA